MQRDDNKWVSDNMIAYCVSCLLDMSLKLSWDAVSAQIS